MYCKALNKEFKNKKEMFAELKANKDILITKKKSEIKCKRLDLPAVIETKSGAVKSLIKSENNKINAIISNTNYMDSHDDVHLNGSMSKTASEQYGKVYYVADHELRVDSIIATPKNVDMQVKVMDWSELGVNADGQTEVLMFGVDKDNIMHEKALKLIESKEPIQNSIRMQYVKIDLAINDNESEQEFKTWNEVYPKLANKERADEQGYFWAVRELKIINEGSMVLFGSNDATPIKDNTEAVNDTSKNEPSIVDTHWDVREALQKIEV